MKRIPSIIQLDTFICIRDEHVLRLRSELARLTAEKEDVQRLHRNLLHDHSNLRQDYDELMREKEEAVSKNLELERALNAASETGKGEFLLRTEIDSLKQDLFVIALYKLIVF